MWIFCLECTQIHLSMRNVFAFASFNNISMGWLMKGRKFFFLVFYMTKFNLLKALHDTLRHSFHTFIGIS